MSIYRPTIEILDDWNDAIAACGCCPMPTCPVPTMDCQTLTGDALSYGFFDAGDTVWTRYKKSETVLLLVEDTAVELKNVHTLASETTSQEYPQLFQGGVGDGTDGCTWWSATTVDECSSTATETVNYTLTLNGSPQTQYQIDRTDVSGQETEEHIAWEIAHPDFEAEYAAWEIAHAAWEVDYAAYEVAYAAWLIAYDAWIAGGEVGDPPVEPTAPVEPVEPEAEPTEFYADCTYKDTTVFTDFTEDPDLVQTTVTYGDNLTTVYSDEGSQVATTTTTLTGGKTYEQWVDTVRDTLIAGITFPQDTCLDAPLCYSSMSVTAEPVSPNLNNDVTMSVQKTRYRWEIPTVGTKNDPDATLPDPPEPLPEGQTEEEWEAEWWADHQVPVYFAGTYFRVVWDVLTEPIGWDDTINDPDETLPDPLPEGYETDEEWWADHQVPRPGRPARSYVEGLEWVWTGPGDPEDAESWRSPWFYLEIPGEPGTRRVCNVRYICYRNPYGSKPEITGEGVDLDEDSPLQLRFTSDKHSIKLPTITI